MSDFTTQLKVFSKGKVPNLKITFYYIDRSTIGKTTVLI